MLPTLMRGSLDTNTAGPSREPRLRRDLVATMAVLALFASSRLAILGVASEREYDEGVYLLSARAVANGERLFTEVFSSQPPAFLESLALVLRVTGDRLAHAQLFSLGWALCLMGATASVARRVAGPVAGPLAAAALAVGVTFTNLAHMVQAELPSLALALSSMAMVLSARERRWESRLLAASGALFGLALLFKFFAAPLALPIAMLLLLEPAGPGTAEPWRIDARGFLPRALRWGLCGALVLALPLLLYDPRSLYEQTVAFHVAKFAAYRSTPWANLGRAGNLAAQDAVVSGAAAAGLVLLFLHRRAPQGAWLGLWGLAMLLVIRKQTPLFWRHLVLLSPPLAILASCAFALPLARTRRPVQVLLGVLAVLAMAVPSGLRPENDRALVPTIPHPSWLPWPSRGDAANRTAPALERTARWIQQHTSPEELVAGDDPIAIYLAGRRAPGQLCDTSMARIAAHSLTLPVATANTSLARVVVLRQEGRLAGLEGFLAWLHAHYERQDPWDVDIGLARNAWIRRDAVPQAGTGQP